MSSYRLKWKGQISGPFDEKDLRPMLENGKIGLLYELELKNGKWIFLRDFLFPNSAQNNIEHPQGANHENFSEHNSGETFDSAHRDVDVEPRQTFQREASKSAAAKKSSQKNEEMAAYLLYALCGASFLSPYIYVAALAICGGMFVQGRRKIAISIAILSTVLFLAGCLFFQFFYPAMTA